MSVAYTETMISFQGTTDGSWTDYDVYTNHSIPKGAILEIACCNPENGNDNVMGVRTDGSSLSRAETLHEAEGGGNNSVTFIVKADSTTGLIEVYSDDVSETYFRILGYWTGLDFTELWTSWGVGTSGWLEKDLGTANSRVHFIHSINQVQTASRPGGVREYGSSLERRIDHHEGEGNLGYSRTVYGWYVKSDSSDRIMYYRVDSDMGYIDTGYFSADLDFVEKWTAKDGTSTASWQTIDLSGDLDQDGRVCNFILSTSEPGNELELGCRKYGSSLSRIIDVHESETNNYNGYTVSVESDANGYVQIYTENNSYDYFYLAGYFKFSTTIIKSVTDSIGLTDAILRNKTLTITDSVGLADLPLRDRPVTELDTVGLSDAIYRHKPLIEILDSATLSELISRGKNISVTDSVGLAELILRNKGLTITTDTVSLADTILKHWTGTIPDLISITDAVYRHKPLVQILDSAGLADTILRNKAFTITDSVSLSEIIDVFKYFFKFVEDSLSLSDTVLRNKTLTISDALQLSDAVFRDKALTILDSLSLTDLATVLKLILITDTVSLTEIIDIIKWIWKDVTDSIGLTDTIRLDKNLTVTDVVNALDTVLRNKVFTITDNLTLTDSVLRDRVLLILDAVGLTEQALTHKSLVIADSVLATDLVLTNKNLIMLDTVGLTDIVLRDKLIFIVDTLGLSDAVVVMPYIPWPGLYIVLDLKTRTMQLVVSKRDLVLELRKRKMELSVFE